MRNSENTDNYDDLLSLLLITEKNRKRELAHLCDAPETGQTHLGKKWVMSPPFPPPIRGGNGPREKEQRY
jgi:hypothetical protein